MKKVFAFIFLFTSLQVIGQVTITPNPFAVDQTITISVNTNSNATDCNGFSNPTKVYIHSGVGTDSNPWAYVQGNWGQDDGIGLMNDDDNDGVWTIEINPKTYYNLTDTQANSITKMGMVFRNENGSQEFKASGCNDFFFDVGNFQLSLITPSTESTVLNIGEAIPIVASSTETSDFTLKANGNPIHTASNTKSYSHSPIVNENTTFILEATNNGQTISKEFNVIVVPSLLVEAPIPAGMKDGINLNEADNTKATLVFYAPDKKFVHLIGSFNNWTIDDTNYLLKKDSTKDRFWIELTGLTSQTNYTYQYLVDRSIRVADPYSTVVLTENNDQYIDDTTYPNLPDYPTGKTNHAVTLLRTGDTYNWQTTNFEKPAKKDLVIYELHIRDFDALHSFDAVRNRLDYLENLGINAIELMPVNEFDGNESWGYNPSFHMALDKYYGTTNAFKSFIDECHKRGIAVIIDIVFNHASGQNPYYRLWNDDDGGYGGKATADSPFFNQEAKHSYNVFNDMNHSKQATQDYVKRITQYWIDEYNIDGFRWDLTKGFTQNCTASNESCTGSYQADRVAVLKEYADYQWEKDPNFYVIFEHLGGNTEETEWINYRLNEGKGIMVWGNHNHNYRNAVKAENSDSDFSWISYKNRGWSAPMNVSYMESHDEERLMYDALQNGKSSGGYSIKNSATALDRLELAGAFFFTVPGPKLIWQFGELGYDYSINFNGRTGNKPIRWDYYNENNRKDIYNTWAKLIQLKLQYDVFRTSVFVMDVGNSNGLKRINLTDSNTTSDLKYVTVIGNFGVTTQSINPQFQQTGTWYNLMDNNSTINVTDTHATISLAPGEYKVFGSSQATLANEEFETLTKKLFIYPNPTNTNLSLSVEANQIVIFDTLGRKIKEFKGNFTQGQLLDVSDLKKGLYLLKINSNRSLIKFIKN